jgi:signal transduction histidine kinase
MPPKIFSNRITLSFRDKYYETQYTKENFSSLRKYNIILSLVLNCISIAITITLIIQYNQLKGIFCSQYLAIFSFIAGTLNLILLLLCIIVRNKNTQKWLSYSNYIMILFVFVVYRFYFSFLIQVDYMIFALVFIIEMVFRLSLYVLGCIDFMPGVYLQVLSIVLNFALFAVMFPLETYFRFTIYTCILIFTTLMSYFYIKEQKSSFYYNMSLRFKNEWYKSIIDNMNSGFISIKEKRIQYFNKTILTYLKKTNETVLNSTETSDIAKVNIDINELVNNIVLEECVIHNFDEATEILNKYYDEKENNFIFLGTKDFELTASCIINIEVFGRCYSSNHNKIDQYEFIFNNITRTKQIEQKNAEFKYKTLFLSKVAHEFKNPLLCICELVDQVGEKLPHSITPMEVTDTLKQIKSMSNYLIILVKDMDFFSQRSSGMFENKLELDKINLFELIKFCKDIVLALIKKSQKEISLSLQVIKDIYLPTYITTDEIKLKQILVNILSNAVKYTNNGLIYLRVNLENNKLKFQVDDTGKGISDSQKEKLFTPFSNDYDKLNKVSSGLGLSIVKELLEMLGSKIEYESVVSKGSSFWFSLTLLDESDLNSSFISDETVREVHFNDGPISYLFSNDDNSEYKNNVIVVDDESVIRQSTIRLLNKVLVEKGIRANIIEASDGIECLYQYYIHIKEGKNVLFIICDETMTFLNGSTTAQIIYEISTSKNMTHLPFYILSAYENLSLGIANDALNAIFTKPLRKQHIEEIIDNIKTVN